MQEIGALLELLAMLVTDPRSGVLIVLLLIAAVADCRTHRIPNWLTFGGAAFALMYAAAVPFAPDRAFLWALGGWTVGLVATLPLYLIRVMGAGDVKLIAMSGAFLGLSGIGFALPCIFIAGGVVAFASVVCHGAAGRVVGNIGQILQSTLVSASTGTRPVAAAASVGRIPYGLSIAVGVIGYLVARQLGYL